MKKRFLTILPLAAAVVLVTSCSKDDNDATDEVVNQEQQTETVVKSYKTVKIKGKLQQAGISKITVDNNLALKFEVDDEFTVSDNNNGVSGKITITGEDGTYEAELNISNNADLSSTFLATKGTPFTEKSQISEAVYKSLEAAVADAYYEISFKVVQNGEEYLLKDYQNANSDILVDLKNDFIEGVFADYTFRYRGSYLPFGEMEYWWDGVYINRIKGEYQRIPVQDENNPGRIYKDNGYEANEFFGNQNEFAFEVASGEYQGTANDENVVSVYMDQCSYLQPDNGIRQLTIQNYLQFTSTLPDYFLKKVEITNVTGVDNLDGTGWVYDETNHKIISTGTPAQQVSLTANGGKDVTLECVSDENMWFGLKVYYEEKATPQP